jgi:hypothetical protein
LDRLAEAAAHYSKYVLGRKSDQTNRAKMGASAQAPERVMAFTGGPLGRFLEIHKALVSTRAHCLVIILVQGDSGASAPCGARGRKLMQAIVTCCRWSAGTPARLMTK